MSDLVDSTGISARLGQAGASRLWAAHDRLARSLLAAWRGLEIDKTDGFLLLFAAPADAVDYALAYHRALATLPEPVVARIGIHSADVTLRRNDPEDVERGARSLEIEDWLAKAVASRVMSIAGGGQTLATADAANAVPVEGPARRQAHGHWQLQGIEAPVALFEFGDDATAFAPPADAAKAWQVVQRDGRWMPARQIAQSLPAESDAFVGRAEVLQALCEQFRGGTRLVSLHGIGGIGKTRIALRFARHWIADFPGGAWFCDLSSASSLDGLLYAVGIGLDLRLDRAESVTQIGRVLAARGRCLLVLDNFEQLAAMAESTVATWMKRAPEARFLVTSRSLLGIAGEHVFTVPSLPLPDAAALFRLRARDVTRQRRPDADDAPAVAGLMALLDGLPLAIELAAARVRIMSPSTLLSRMGDRFGLLAAASRPVKRHATLRATLDWSWEQLSPRDRSALAQLTVFEGGFRLADAEAVLALPGPAADGGGATGVRGESEGGGAIDAVQSLVEQSMVRSVGPEHFDLLRSVQEYAREHLARPAATRHGSASPAGIAEPASAAEPADTGAVLAVQRRHWQHFAGLDERTLGDGIAPVDNLVAACRRATAAADAASAAGVLGLLWTFLRRSGPFKPVLELAQGVLGLSGLTPAGRSLVGRVQGAANELLGHVPAARAAMESALVHAREAGDRPGQGWCLCALGEHLYKRGHPASARQCLQEGLDIADELDSAALRCATLNALGTLAWRVGDNAAAQAHYDRALRLARDLHDEARVGGLLGNLAILANEAGAPDTARALYEQSLALVVKVRDRRWEGNTRSNLGLLCQEQGLGEAAQAQFEAALAIALETGHAMLEATVRCNLGIVASERGEFAAARLHFEQAVDAARHSGERRAEGQFLGHLGESHARCGRFGEAFAALGAAEAALQEVGDDTSLAMLRCQRAVAEHLAGDAAAAEAVLQRVRQSPTLQTSAELRRALARAEARPEARAAVSSAVVGDDRVAGAA